MCEKVSMLPTTFINKEQNCTTIPIDGRKASENIQQLLT